MIRKAAKYCAGRDLTTSQPATTTSTVMKAVRRISGIEMPSTPSWYQALKAGIQAARSVNCIAVVCGSKRVHSGRLAASVRMATPSARRRAAMGRPSPSASTARPPAIGSQMRVLRMGRSVGSMRTRP
jgi:hypothetical protein